VWKTVFSVFAFLTTIGAALAQESAAIYQEEVAPWIIQCLNDDGGVFSHCSATTLYYAKGHNQYDSLSASKIMLLFSYDGKENMGIDISNKEWSVILRLTVSAFISSYSSFVPCWARWPF
jgi:hypothetical protein